MKILVYGAGVLGCELVSTLCRGKAHVTLLARGAWKDTIDQRGLAVRHVLQLHTTQDQIPTVDHLEPHWVFDLIFVAVQANQLPEVLPELRANLSRHIVFIGNNAAPEETEQLLLTGTAVEKEVAFGFLSAAGHRDGPRVVCFHKGVHLTIGGLGHPLSMKFDTLLRKAACHTPLQIRLEPEMGAWLKCHLTLILPLCFAIYAQSGHMKRITSKQRSLCLAAAQEGCALLKALEVPICDEDSTDWFQPGCKRRCMTLMLYMLAKTPLGPLCVGDHAMRAVAEMRCLDQVFQSYRAEAGLIMPAWDTLRQESLPILYPIHHHHHR